MVNKLSAKAGLLVTLREKAGEPVSGAWLAKKIGVSRVSIWKGIQALTEAGYPIENKDKGYTIDPRKFTDFLYPWEFGEKEPMFRYFSATDSTMDRAQEFALQGLENIIITAEKQSAGRGRNGSPWVSRQGGLFCTILERPGTALADYCLPSMVFQIATARVLSSVCGKFARLRWPNDIYVNKQKIAGLMTELEGEGDMINWLAIGIGVNVNNAAPSDKAVSCAGLIKRTVSRSKLLLKILYEAEQIKRNTRPDTAYSQGNRMLADEWNSMADCIGSKVTVVASDESKNKIIARGIFSGIDPAGRCIIKAENSKGALYFNPGPVSLIV